MSDLSDVVQNAGRGMPSCHQGWRLPNPHCHAFCLPLFHTHTQITHSRAPASPAQQDTALRAGHGPNHETFRVAAERSTSTSSQHPQLLPKPVLVQELSHVSCVHRRVYKGMLPKTPSQVASSKPCIFSTLGYILATLVVVWCALFVMLFGFTFGPVVSRAFLLSMLFSTVLAVLLMQPLSIIMSLYVVPPPPRVTAGASL